MEPDIMARTTITNNVKIFLTFKSNPPRFLPKLFIPLMNDQKNLNCLKVFLILNQT